MNIFPRIQLKWRLLLGFLLCAVITAFSGGIGILSLQQIQGNITEKVGGNIEQLTAQSRQLTILRELIADIDTAGNEKKLQQTQKDLLAFKGSRTADSQIEQKVLKDIEAFLAHRRDQLRNRRDLEALRELSNASLETVNEAALVIVGNSEKNSTRTIEDTLNRIKANASGSAKDIANGFDTLSDTSSEAILTIKAAMKVRTYCHELNAVVKDSLLSTDPAAVDYSRTTIATLLGNAKNEISVLPRDETTQKLTLTLDELAAVAGGMLKEKKQILSVDKGAYRTSAGLSRSMGRLDKLVENVNMAALDAADNAEFNATIAIEDALSRIKTNTANSAEDNVMRFDTLSETSSQATAIMKAAMKVRTGCHELNALVKDSLLAADSAIVDRSRDTITTLLGNAKRELSILPVDQTTRKLAQSLDELAGNVDGMLRGKNRMLSVEKALGNTEAGLAKSMSELNTILINEANHIQNNADETLRSSSHMVGKWQYVLFFLCAGAFLLALAVGVVIANSITNPINRIIKGLRNGGEQMATVSAQISIASQQLAEGSSEQAASLEETASSLEEMSTMTRRNAEHADHADNLTKNVNQVIDKANASMGDLTGSMEEISKDSEEISKIIKTIDDIAFQTNLLALNAAVEAARAGDAGAGFSVVADEVRTLALRTTDAAKKTSDLIESSVRKIQEGFSLVRKTNQEFSEVTQSASKVIQLIGSINAASNEQANGIEQLNKAVAEMDKVTQQNAANAEENAGASEEMSAQAEQMRHFVGDLVTMVGQKTADARDMKEKKTPASTLLITQGEVENERDIHRQPFT